MCGVGVRPFDSWFDKRKIIISLSFIERTDRFRFVDMMSLQLLPLRLFTRQYKTQKADRVQNAD